MDDSGLSVRPPVHGPHDVLFDGENVWSFHPSRGANGQVSWPPAMRPFLNGTATLALRDPQGVVHDLGEHSFGDGKGRVSFRDKNGIPVVIDKWGIVQRPFERRDPQVRRELGARTQEIISAIEEDCGISVWLSFGSLLGAAREGGAIGHDSDVDLLFLSSSESPADVNRELYAITRALSRRGYSVVLKSGSFLTVLFKAADGGPLGIDVYASFYVKGLLHETATVRAPLPRSSILPLTTLPYEGLRLPAPADPDAVLTLSYGKNWRTPDPGFRHRPGPDIARRFDGWFGNLMTNRRAWEQWWTRQEQTSSPGPRALAGRVLAETAREAAVVDVGCGAGADVMSLAAAGRHAVGLDYVRKGFLEPDSTDGTGSLFQLSLMNLYDERDVLTMAATLNRTLPRERVVTARHVLDAVQPRGAEMLLRFTRMILRRGGTAYFQFSTAPGAAPGSRTGSFGQVNLPRYAVSPQELVRRIESLGGSVLALDDVEPDWDRGAQPLPTWLVVSTWT